MARLERYFLNKPSFDIRSKKHVAVLQEILKISNAPPGAKLSIHWEIEGQPPQILVLEPASTSSGPILQRHDDTSSVPPSTETETSSDVPTRDAPLSEDCDDSMIYCVGSYGKIFINMLWLMLSKSDHGILEKSACEVFNHYQDLRKQPVLELLLPRNPSIRSLLCHIHGFSAINQLMIGPEGSFLLTDRNFLDQALNYTTKYGQKDLEFTYSNANHPFAGMIAQAMTGKPLLELMTELVFNPMDMSETAMNERGLDRLSETNKVLDGYKINSDGWGINVGSRKYLGSLVEAVSLGFRSTLRNIANFNREILLVLMGQSTCGLEYEDIEEFLRGEYSTMGGINRVLNSRDGYEESPNKFVYGLDYEPYRLGKRKDGSVCEGFHKSGYIDGFSSNVTLMPKEGAFLIVLVNTTGPVDVAYHVSRYILQKAFNLDPDVNIVRKVTEEKELCLPKLRSLECRDVPNLMTLPLACDLAGTYKEIKCGQQITVDQDGSIRIHNEEKSTEKMKLVYTDQTKTKVEILPGSSDSGIDRWSVWDDLNFTVRITKGQRSLIRANGKDCYAMET